jgi:hypothetical protein
MKVTQSGGHWRNSRVNKTHFKTERSHKSIQMERYLWVRFMMKHSKITWLKDKYINHLNLFLKRKSKIYQDLKYQSRITITIVLRTFKNLRTWTWIKFPMNLKLPSGPWRIKNCLGVGNKLIKFKLDKLNWTLSG